MKWVTRARPKVDRIACPWLIKRFVDPQAEFLYVPGDEVMAVASREGATPFDVPDVELGHHGAECSFDAIIKKYNLMDPALTELALIVRGADPDAIGYDGLRLDAVLQAAKQMAGAAITAPKSGGQLFLQGGKLFMETVIV